MTIKISDIPVSPVATERSMEVAREFLKECSSDKARTLGVRGICYATVNAEGTIKKTYNGACHAGIKSYGAVNNPVLIVTRNGFDKRQWPAPLAEEDVQPFLDWFTQRSWMAPFILNRDTYKEDGGFIKDANLYLPLLQNINITSRYTYERSELAFNLFNKLVRDDGVSEDLAFILAFSSGLSGTSSCDYYSKKKVDTWETMPVSTNGAHISHHLSSVDGLRNFLSGQTSFTSLGKTYHEGNRSYTGGFYAFSPANDVGLVASLFRITAFTEALGEYRRNRDGGGEMYRPPNPFAPPQPGQMLPGNITYREYIDFAIPFVVDLLTVKEKALAAA